MNARGLVAACLRRGGLDSLEQHLLGQIAAAGLPMPKTAFRFAPPHPWRAELLWDYHRVIAEIGGGGKQYQSDCDKMFEAQMMGYLVVWVTGEEIGRKRRGVWVPDPRAITKIRRAIENGPKRIRREVVCANSE